MGHLRLHILSLYRLIGEIYTFPSMFRRNSAIWQSAVSQKVRKLLYLTLIAAEIDIDDWITLIYSSFCINRTGRVETNRFFFAVFECDGPNPILAIQDATNALYFQRRLVVFFF